MPNENETQPPQTAPATGSPAVPPLHAVHWSFPLGACEASLIMVARNKLQVVPEDMDALIEMAGILKKQLQRRQAHYEDSEGTTDEPGNISVLPQGD